MPTTATIPDKLNGLVHDAMTVKVHTATVGTKLPAVATMMATHNLRRIIVIDKDKCVKGVISQRDVVRAMITGLKDGEDRFSKLEVQNIFTREQPVTLSADVPLAKAAFVLATNKIGCLPVVGENQELCGVLSTSDLIQHLAGINAENCDQGFKMYDPGSEGKVKKPAFIRKVNGDIVIPLSNIGNKRAKLDQALLGYDPPTGRILVKFVRGNTPEALSTTISEGNVVIPALGFVRQFDLIGKSNAFTIENHNHSRFLVLSPKQKS
ncbi:MAG: CBS domain-containing protein [Pirellulales bacterium]